MANWILTFILGFIGGAVGTFVFIQLYGRKLQRDKAIAECLKNTTEVQLGGVYDGDGNPIEEGDPRYEEAMKLAKEIENRIKNGK